MINLPAHAETSGTTTTVGPTATTTVGPTTTTTTTAAPAGGCATPIWSGQTTLLNGNFISFTFDGMTGNFIPTLFPPSNSLFVVDHRGDGDYFGPVGSATWNVSGIRFGQQIVAENSSDRLTLTATNNNTKEVFEICLTVSRIDDPSAGPSNSTYTANVGPL